MRPGSLQKRSQMDSPLPSSRPAPSIWKEEVDTPQRKSAGKSLRVGAVLSLMKMGSGSEFVGAAEQELAPVGRVALGQRGVGVAGAGGDADAGAVRPVAQVVDLQRQRQALQRARLEGIA